MFRMPLRLEFTWLLVRGKRCHFDFPTIAAMNESEPFGVIWDMDGTFVDTAELHFQAWSETARELNLPFTPADFAATFGKRNPEILRQLYGNRFSEDEIAH